MGTRTFIVCAVLAVLAGVVGRMTYEQVVDTRTPALAQDEDPRTGRDCDDFRSQAEAQAALRQDPSDTNVLDEDEGPDDGVACETTDYDDPTRDETPVAGTTAAPHPTPTTATTDHHSSTPVTTVRTRC